MTQTGGSVGLFGGTFNPPHNGHLHLSRTAAETLELDRLLWVPCGVPPHKPMPPGSPTPTQRLELCRLAAQASPNTEVLDCEIHKTDCYTIDTVQWVQSEMTPDTLWLIVGADMFVTLGQWVRADALFAACRIAVLARQNNEATAILAAKTRFEAQYRAQIRVLAAPPLPVSSTELRAAHQSAYLPAAVAAYIKQHHLYKQGTIYEPR